MARAKPLPLRVRLPNPPPFAGRVDDTRWLQEAIEAHPVTFIAGPGGIGKTALVQHALSGMRRRKAKTLFIAAEHLEQAQVLQEVVRALAGALSREVDWEELQSEPDHVATLALDLAELGPWTVVLDGLSLRDEFERWLVQMLFYARKSRWVVTAASPPTLQKLRVAARVLQPMTSDELSAMARQSGLGRDGIHVEQSVVAAAGSPFRLLQALAGEATEGVLHGLSPGALLLLRTLSGFSAPVELQHLALVVAAPSDELLSDLQRRGLATINGSHIAPHALVRSLLPPDPDACVRAATALEKLESGEAQLEALHLRTRGADTEGFRILLERQMDSLLAGGWGHQVWGLLRDLEAPEVQAAKLRCAASLGNATMLARIHSQPPVATNIRVDLAEASWASGEIERALVLLAGRTNPSDSRVRARCHIARNELAEARGALSGEPEDAGLLQLLGAIGGELPRRVPTESIDGQADLAEALAVGRMPRDAIDYVTRLVPRVELIHGRRAWLSAARAGVRTLELEFARDCIERLRPLCRAPSILHGAFCIVVLQLRLAAGELDGFPEALHLALHEVAPGDARSCAELQAVGREYRRLHGLGADPEMGGRAATEIAAGRAADALSTANQHARQAERDGRIGESTLALIEAQDALMAGENFDALEVEELERRSSRCGSGRFAAHAAFLRVVQAYPIDPSKLERVALSMNAAPVAARRARALLGAEVALSDVDLRVLESLAPRVGAVELCAGQFHGLDGSWNAGFGYDEQLGQAWLTEGIGMPMPVSSLSARILLALCDGHGSASKEQLVVQAWGEKEYHPLRHDGRLHVAIRKLRSRLQDDAAQRIVTTDEGYKVAARMLRRRAL